MPRRLRIGYSRSVRISGDLGSYALSGQTAEFVHQYAITMTGPTTGQQGVASTNFTIGSTRAVGTSIIVTPSDSGQFGTFTPTTVTLTTGSPTSTFTYTPISTGSKTISVTNDQGQANPANITYVSTLSLPVFTQASPPAGTIGVAYSYQFVATGAVSYSLVSGTLPAGLTISSSGLLSGTPTTASVYSFTVGATNAFGTTSTAESVTVSTGTNPTFANVDDGRGVDETGATTVTIPSLTLAANSLALLSIVAVGDGAASNEPSVAGWTVVRSLLSGSIQRVTVLRRLSSTTDTQGYTIAFGGQAQMFVRWSIDQSSANVKTTGTNGADAIVQIKDGFETGTLIGTYCLLTFDNAFSSSSNSTFAMFGGSVSGSVPTAGSGFTELSRSGVEPFGNRALFTEYKAENDTTADMSWTTGYDIWNGIALEIAAQGGIVPSSPTFLIVTAGNDQLTADWTLPETLVGGDDIADDPITSQTVRWGPTIESVAIGGSPTGSASVSASAITYTITGLANATLYYVTVTATNSSGESETTFAISGTTT